MEYRTTRKDKTLYVTSILKGDERPRRLIGNKFVEAESQDPLLRILSINPEVPSDGKYAIAYFDADGEWIITKARFTNARTAEKYLPGLHMVFPSLAVIQLWEEKQAEQPWMGLDREDPNDFGEDTGEI